MKYQLMSVDSLHWRSVMDNRKDVVAMTVNLLVRRRDVDDNGPAQDLSAVRQFVTEFMDGATVEVRERNNLGRAPAEYRMAVLNSFVMTARQTSAAVDALGS